MTEIEEKIELLKVKRAEEKEAVKKQMQQDKELRAKAIAEKKASMQAEKLRKEAEKAKKEQDKAIAIADKRRQHDEAQAAIGGEMIEIIERDDIHYISELNIYAIRLPGKINYETEYGTIVMNTFRWSYHSRSAMETKYPVMRGVENWNAWLGVMDNYPDRMKNGQASGISVPASDLNLLQLKPVEDVEGESHWIFDTLIASICGGKQENIDHIEQCLLWKRRQPGEIFIPWIVLNDGGGTGKDLFTSTIMANLLGPWTCNTNLPLSQLVGRFGDAIAGKCTALVNEKPEDGESLGTLKGMNGSRNFTLEMKGKGSCSTQSLLWCVLASNNDMGTVALANNDSDRRYSIISGKEPLKYYVSKMLNELEIIPNCSEMDAKRWVETVGQYILSDLDEYGKWMKKIHDKWGDNMRPEALHGADYDSLLSTQKSDDIKTWERFFEDDENFTHVKQCIVWNYYDEHADKSGKLGAKRFYARMKTWMEKNHPDFVCDKVNIKTQTNDPKKPKIGRADVIYDKSKADGKTFNNNDFQYCKVDDRTGRHLWMNED